MIQFVSSIGFFEGVGKNPPSRKLTLPILSFKLLGRTLPYLVEKIEFEVSLHGPKWLSEKRIQYRI